MNTIEHSKLEELYRSILMRIAKFVPSYKIGIKIDRDLGMLIGKN